MIKNCFLCSLFCILLGHRCHELFLTSWMSKDTISPSPTHSGLPRTPWHSRRVPSWLALDSWLVPASRLPPDFRLSLMFLTHPWISDSHLPSRIARGLPSVASLRQILHSKCFITSQLLVGKVLFKKVNCDVAILAILHKEELAKFSYRRGK
jgi:hypothetical protein